jgi:hypothetical protein
VVADEICKPQRRVIALLESYGGEKLTTAAIAAALRIDVSSLCQLLPKLLEYRKLSHAWASNESVWWIEPRRLREPEPAFSPRGTRLRTAGKLVRT